MHSGLRFLTANSVVRTVVIGVQVLNHHLLRIVVLAVLESHHLVVLRPHLLIVLITLGIQDHLYFFHFVLVRHISDEFLVGSHQDVILVSGSEVGPTVVVSQSALGLSLTFEGFGLLLNH